MLVNGFEVAVKVINNNKEYTLLSIHGMNSTMSFISPLDKKPNHFNHIKITLPQKGHITVDEMNEVIKSIIDNNINTHHLVLLGHSLGAVQALANASNVKVRKVIFVSPVNPSALTPRKKNLLDATFGTGRVGSSVNNWFEKHNKSKDGILSPVLDPQRPYRDAFMNYVMKPIYMKELDDQYKANTKPSLYIIGNLDVFVDPKTLESYLKTFGQKLHIVKGGHNPFRYDPWAMRTIINEFIPDEERINKKEIWKDS